MITVEQALAIGEARIAAGAPAQGLPIFRRIREALPDLPEAYYGLARCHFELGSKRHGTDCLRILMALAPDHHDVYRQVAKLLFRHAGPAEGAAALRRSLRLVPPDGALTPDLAAAALRHGAYPEAADALSFYVQHCRQGRFAKTMPAHLELLGAFPPGSVSRAGIEAAAGCGRSQEAAAALDYILANHLFVEGRLDQAQALFQRAAARDSLFKYGRLVRFDPDFMAMVEREGDERIAALTGARFLYAAETLRSGPERPGVFIAVDAGYFRRYAVPLVHTLAGLEGELDVFVHLYDQDAGIIGQLEAFARRFADLRLFVSHETMRFDHMGYEARIAWFTSLRFVRLHQIVERTGRPLISIDVDMLPLGPLSQILVRSRHADLAVVGNTNPADPFNKLFGLFLIAFPSEAGRAYTRTLARTIAWFLTNGMDHWHMDQLALYLSLRHAAAAIPGFRLFDVYRDDATAGWFHSLLSFGSCGQLDTVIGARMPED